MSFVTLTQAQSRDQLILSHLPQVRLLATRAHRRCPNQVALEDLISAGTTGLIQAVDRFDATRKLKLKTFAAHRIQGAILDYLRQLDPLSRPVRQFVRHREAAKARLSAHCGSVPGVEKLALELNLSLNEYHRLESAAQAKTVLSHDGATVGYGDIAAPEDRTVEDRLAWSCVEAAIKQFFDSERSILLALKSRKSTREIAQSLRLSEGRVSQIKKQAIRRLQTVFGVGHG